MQEPFRECGHIFIKLVFVEAIRESLFARNFYPYQLQFRFAFVRKYRDA